MALALQVSLGTDERGHEVLLSDRQLAAHGLIVGASGAGKSTTLLGILGDPDSARTAGDRDRPEGLAGVRGRARARGRGHRTADPDLDTGRPEPLEPARTRQPDRAQGQADRIRALHRTPLSASRGALRPDGPPGPASRRPRAGDRQCGGADGAATPRGGRPRARLAAARAGAGLHRRADRRPDQRRPRARNATGDHQRVPRGALPDARHRRRHGRPAGGARRTRRGRLQPQLEHLRTGSPRSSARSRSRTSSARPAIACRRPGSDCRRRSRSTSSRRSAPTTCWRCGSAWTRGRRQRAAGDPGARRPRARRAGLPRPGPGPDRGQDRPPPGRSRLGADDRRARRDGVGIERVAPDLRPVCSWLRQPRHAARGRAVRRAPQRDQDAAHGRGRAADQDARGRRRPVCGYGRRSRALREPPRDPRIRPASRGSRGELARRRLAQSAVAISPSPG